jgi:branched-chain amino acid transport system ATP-binding protein
MLELDNVHASYGPSRVLHGVSLDVRDGEVVSLLGRNGVGKTTTLLTVMGYLPVTSGRIAYRGEPLTQLSPFRVSRRGLGFVPQERGIFPSLTVRENLTVAARAGLKGRWTLDEVYKRFPRIRERAGNMGFQLSGGEQQMLSIARALMLNPSLLILDEPSEGLAPLIVKEIVEILRDLRNEGLAILLVEQNLRAALAVADRHYILSKGAVCFTGTTADLQTGDAIKTHLSVEASPKRL